MDNTISDLSQRDKIRQFSKNNDVIVQISLPRSGRHWLWSLFDKLSDKKVGNLRWADNLKQYLFVSSHALIQLRNNVRYIILVRDPRDVFLSWAYHRIKHNKMKENTTSEFLFEKIIKQRCSTWRQIIETYRNFDEAFFIQYEHLCLFPVNTLQKLIDFIDFTPVRSIGESIKSADVTSAPINNKNFHFTTNRERYLEHSLKWQRDDLFLPEFNVFVYNELNDLMKEFGYIKTGHHVEKWQRKFGGC